MNYLLMLLFGCFATISGWFALEHWQATSQMRMETNETYWAVRQILLRDYSNNADAHADDLFLLPNSKGVSPACFQFAVQRAGIFQQRDEDCAVFVGDHKDMSPDLSKNCSIALEADCARIQTFLSKLGRDSPVSNNIHFVAHFCAVLTAALGITTLLLVLFSGLSDLSNLCHGKDCHGKDCHGHENDVGSKAISETDIIMAAVDV